MFISYLHDEALDYATQAKTRFSECGFRTWVWYFDRGPTGSAKLEMIKNIEACDYFLDISTVASRVSEGQEFEREEARKRNKALIILTFDKEYISEVWNRDRDDDPVIYNEVSDETFAPMCRIIAQKLLPRPAAERTEGEPLEPA